MKIGGEGARCRSEHPTPPFHQSQPRFVRVADEIKFVCKGRIMRIMTTPNSKLQIVDSYLHALCSTQTYRMAVFVGIASPTHSLGIGWLLILDIYRALKACHPRIA